MKEAVSSDALTQEQKDSNNFYIKTYTHTKFLHVTNPLSPILPMESFLDQKSKFWSILLQEKLANIKNPEYMLNCGIFHIKKTEFKNFKYRPGTCNFIKKRLWHRCFPVNFAKFLRISFFKEHLWRLLLNTVTNVW